MYLLTTLDWLVKMAYWSSYDTTVNSSSDVQWTVMVSYEAVHNSSRITGGFGAASAKTKGKCPKGKAETLIDSAQNGIRQ